MNAQWLYELYMEMMARQGVEIDPWDTLESTEVAAWGDLVAALQGAPHQEQIVVNEMRIGPLNLIREGHEVHVVVGEEMKASIEGFYSEQWAAVAAALRSVEVATSHDGTLVRGGTLPAPPGAS